uniref:Uncharacterized protein n=1 Tax=Helicotheca tamesis TaxID=374047 RepID=A0A7S2HJ52_9STRA
MTAVTVSASTPSAAIDSHRTELADNGMATTTEGFNILSNLNLDDCDHLDPSLFTNVTPEDLDSWLLDSLNEFKGDEISKSKVTEVGRRLSLCLGAEIGRRHSLMLGGDQRHLAATRRGSTFSEFNFDSSTLPHMDHIFSHEGVMKDQHPQAETAASVVPQQENSSCSAGTRPSKRQRVDHSLSSDDQFLNGLLTAISESSHSFANLLTASDNANVQSSSFPQHETASSHGNNMASRPPPSLSTAPFLYSSTSALSSATCPPTGASVYNSPILEALRIKACQGPDDDKLKKSAKSSAPTPVVPLLSAVSGLISCMDMSEKSEQEIHDWDRNMGLRRSHSKTMRATARSRKKLQQLQKQLCLGDIKQCRAKGA